MASRRETIRELFGSDVSDLEEDTPDRARAQLPRVGTSIQRTDREQRRRRAMLLETPPPPPRRSRGPPGTQTRQRPSPATPTVSRGVDPDLLSPGREPVVATTSRGNMGPALPPSVRVTLPSGEVAEVPHFAAHISRHYRVRVPSGRTGSRAVRIFGTRRHDLARSCVQFGISYPDSRKDESQERAQYSIFSGATTIKF
ncbi:hypothetical protein ACFW04_012704 [Cataglyphis niger]